MKEQEYYKPSQIAEQKLIPHPFGYTSKTAIYRYVVRMIHQGKLKADVWAIRGDRNYYRVHVDDIAGFNRSNAKSS